MKPQPKTLALVALASGMLASAYFIGSAPAATAIPGAARPIPAMAVAPPKPATTIKTFQAPVPLLMSAHSDFFTASPTDATPASAPSPEIATARADGAAARAAIEQDGYRGVKMLVKGPDGAWHGRALRGSTEVAVRVDASGSVATD